jgi:hypothetical protein
MSFLFVQNVLDSGQRKHLALDKFNECAKIRNPLHLSIFLWNDERWSRPFCSSTAFQCSDCTKMFQFILEDLFMRLRNSKWFCMNRFCIWLYFEVHLAMGMFAKVPSNGLVLTSPPGAHFMWRRGAGEKCCPVGPDRRSDRLAKGKGRKEGVSICCSLHFCHVPTLGSWSSELKLFHEKKNDKCQQPVQKLCGKRNPEQKVSLSCGSYGAPSYSTMGNWLLRASNDDC